MTIPRWIAHPIPPARSPDKEIFPMIPATAMAIRTESKSAKMVRKGKIICRYYQSHNQCYCNINGLSENKSISRYNICDTRYIGIFKC